jgi:hypothetical protein
MKFVYISAPYNKNIMNVLMAVDVAEKIQTKIPDVAVFLPHLFHHWATYYPDHTEKFWLDLDLAWLTKCDAVYRVSGLSEGADIEVARAKKLGIPVFMSMDELMEWATK